MVDQWECHQRKSLGIVDVMEHLHDQVFLPKAEAAAAASLGGGGSFDFDLKVLLVCGSDVLPR